MISDSTTAELRMRCLELATTTLARSNCYDPESALALSDRYAYHVLTGTSPTGSASGGEDKSESEKPNLPNRPLKKRR